jgi:predicted Zn-dependent protease
VNAVPTEGQGVGMVLDLIDAQGRTPAQAGRAAMEEAGFSLQSGDAITVNGLNGWTGVFAGDDGQNTYGVRAAFFAHAGRVYRIAGIAPAASFSSAESTFASVIRSFRGLSQSEADAIQPARIDFHTARAGDTWESLAKSLGRGAISANALAIMNGSSPSTPPVAGARLRVVIGD